MKQIKEMERIANLTARLIANEMQLQDIVVRVSYRRDNQASRWE